jgi:hypothetical protein
MARNSPATAQRHLLNVADKPVRQFRVGHNWLRWETQRDPVSGLYLRGLRLEPIRANLRTYSNQIDQWTKGIAGDSTDTNGALGLYGEATADGLIADNTTGQHRRYLGKTLSGVNHAYWCIAKQGNFKYIALYDGNSGRGKYFDLDLVEVGNSIGTIVGSGIQSLGGDPPWCFAWLVFLANAAATNTFIYSIETNGNLNSTGDGSTVNTWFDHVQLESGLYPSSRIDAVDSNQTRQADDPVVWEIAPTVNREFTVLVPIITPKRIPTSFIRLFSVYKDGAQSTDHVSAWIRASNGKFRATSAATGETGGEAIVDKVVSDYELHWCSLHAQHGRLTACMDGEYAFEFDAGIADDLNRISVDPHGGWSGRPLMWPKFMERQPRPMVQYFAA